MNFPHFSIVLLLLCKKLFGTCRQWFGTCTKMVPYVHENGSVRARLILVKERWFGTCKRCPQVLGWCPRARFCAQGDSSSLRTMPIIDDDVVIMCPSDMLGCDNRGTKGVRLGQLVLGEPVSH